MPKAVAHIILYATFRLDNALDFLSFAFTLGENQNAHQSHRLAATL